MGGPAYDTKRSNDRLFGAAPRHAGLRVKRPRASFGRYPRLAFVAAKKVVDTGLRRHDGGRPAPVTAWRVLSGPFGAEKFSLHDPFGRSAGDCLTNTVAPAPFLRRHQRRLPCEETSMTPVPHARNGHRCAVASRARKNAGGAAREMVRLWHDRCDAGHSASGSLRARFGFGPECGSRSPSQSRLRWQSEEAPNVRNRYRTPGFGSHSDTGSITAQ
jgi:hypothetical protein